MKNEKILILLDEFNGRDEDFESFYKNLLSWEVLSYYKFEKLLENNLLNIFYNKTIEEEDNVFERLSEAYDEDNEEDFKKLKIEFNEWLDNFKE